ncbi:AAA family ATPase [Amycolatopsis sp. CA-230715]|uniref:AAA family ATPase n=1 Tax=Amycolatopsis sp. CA-230715 TaxID=2745196 RepID=UPI001C02F043|nr:AAA family ATPase [Amycolatopsis sp. CA-230715]QWF84692.1 hypothetical protein HUW46_08144 [Amycolatopsis sp. CA-230715]
MAAVRPSLREARVILIGGTSNVGKSTVAQALADRLEYEYRSTDKLARHPGRPWPTPDRAVPAHVAEHYRTLTVDELITSVLEHYQRLWPRVEQLIADRAANDTGLVLEGSGLWPALVAELTVPRTAAIWLTAEKTVLSDRMRAASGYEEADQEHRHLVEKFLGRTIRYQELMLADLIKLGLPCLPVGGHTVGELADAVLARALS